MFDGIKKLLNLTRRVKEQMADLELLVDLLNKRIEYLDNENDELRKDNRRLRQFLSGQERDGGADGPHAVGDQGGAFSPGRAL